MSQATLAPMVPAPDLDAEPDVDMVVTIEVGPDGLDRYLAIVGGERGPLIRCHRGSLTLVSPTFDHESGSRSLDVFVGELCTGLDITFRDAGSTLLRPPGRKDGGIEPDCCFYIAHEAAIRNAGEHLDLSIHPPPDLCLEVVATHSPAKALTICAELGIPEVWTYRVRRRCLEFLHLEGDRYVPRERGRSFPFLAPGDVLPWLLPRPDEPDNRWRRRLRAWIDETIAPRLAGP